MGGPVPRHGYASVQSCEIHRWKRKHSSMTSCLSSISSLMESLKVSAPPPLLSYCWEMFWAVFLCTSVIRSSPLLKRMSPPGSLTPFTLLGRTTC